MKQRVWTMWVWICAGADSSTKRLRFAHARRQHRGRANKRPRNARRTLLRRPLTKVFCLEARFVTRGLQPASRTSRSVGKRQSAILGRLSRAVRARSFLPVLAGALLLFGCSQAHYRRSADKEVYGIIGQYESEIFGQTNAFTIDTHYSARKPEAILPAELIESRLQTGHRMLTNTQSLNLAVRSSRRYQSAKETLYLTALSLTGSRYAFSPQFFANSTATATRESDGDQFGSVNSQAGGQPVSEKRRTIERQPGRSEERRVGKEC